MNTDPQHWKALVRQFYAKGELCVARDIVRNVLMRFPEDLEAAHTLGVLSLADDEPEEAVDVFRRLLRRDVSAERYFDLAVALEALGERQSARTNYEMALRTEPGHYAARLNLCALLQVLKCPDEALEQANVLVSKFSDVPEAWCALGHAHFAGFDPEAAATAFARALVLSPDHLPSRFGHASALAMCGELATAAQEIGDLRQLGPPPATLAAIPQSAEILALTPEGLFDLYATAVFERMRRGDWDCRAILTASLLDMVSRLAHDSACAVGKAAAFYALVLGLGQEACRALACRAASTETAAVPLLFEHQKPLTLRPDRRIRLGFISPAFRHHPSAYLVREMFRLHDRARFEVIGYCIGNDDGSAVRKEIVEGCDRFVSLARLSDDAAAACIHADEVDILVQFEGFLDGTRNRILAQRPARVQVAHVGVVGWLDAEYVDYRFCEDFGDGIEGACSPGLDQAVVFKEVYTPYGAPSEPWGISVRRSDYGLPEEVFVFCSFNNDYKIEPEVFAAWLAVLKAVPDSVLWLRASENRLWEHCCTMAKEAGLCDSRLIRAVDEANDRHLARLRLADLMLDTFVCNAHTTALDALWMGLPVITCRGFTPASSLCSVFLRQLGLETLIHRTTGAYITEAIRLASDRAYYRTIRRKLMQARTTTQVFNMAHKVRLYEVAYERMWGRYCNGLVPSAFEVQALSMDRRL